MHKFVVHGIGHRQAPPVVDPIDMERVRGDCQPPAAMDSLPRQWHIIAVRDINPQEGAWAAAMFMTDPSLYLVLAHAH
ncbi:hypothetical protein WG908_11495 [Sphingobium sp. AN641]|uniref:hypothetical protein n=1 Tax=Sphingobium sp. AN641 TaxID=3133443 RepID=UPI0030BAA429